MAFLPGIPKFDFTYHVKKKIAKILTAEKITGELLKQFYWPRDRPIFIRPISYELSFLLSARELFVDHKNKDDNLLDQYLFNGPIIDFNDKDEPLEGPKNHTNPTKSDQPNHNSNDHTRTIDLTNTSVTITDKNKFKKPLNLETKCPVCIQIFSN